MSQQEGAGQACSGLFVNPAGQRRSAFQQACAGLFDALRVADGAEQALAMLAQQPADVLVLDLECFEIGIDLPALGQLVAQRVHAAHRVEAGDGVGGGVHRLGVNGGVVVGLDLADERRGDDGPAHQLHVVVVLVQVAGQLDPPEHDRGGQRLAAPLMGGAPVRHARGQVAHVDAALVPQFIDLRVQRTGGALGHRELVRVMQQGGQAGAPPGQELGQARGVGVGDVDAVGGRRGEPQRGVRAGPLPQGLYPAGHAFGGSSSATSHDSHSLRSLPVGGPRRCRDQILPPCRAVAAGRFWHTTRHFLR
nr:hypothetical protein [Massilia sp. UBA6681]